MQNYGQKYFLHFLAIDFIVINGWGLVLAVGVYYHKLRFTLCLQAFLHLIFPFRWQLTYVPVLPLALLELLEAPGTFIMGCHSSHKHFIDQVCLVTAICHACQSSSLHRRPYNTLSLPCECVIVLKKKFYLSFCRHVLIVISYAKLT